MKAIRWSCLTLAFAVANLLSASSTWAQITYDSVEFESSALASTDDDPAQDFVISQIDEPAIPGDYTFDEYGSSPSHGYSASVGTQHDSTLTTTGMSLSGNAHIYLRDDYGYGFASAQSEVVANVRFTLTSARHVEIAGSLTKAGYVNYYNSQFTLQNSNGDQIVSVTGPDAISYSGDLAAGSYQLVVNAYATSEMSHPGGDMYETGDGAFQVTVETSQAASPEIKNVKHSVSTSYVGNDPYGDDFPSDSESIVSRKFEQFVNELDMGQGGPTAKASLNSDLSKTDGWFYAYGYAATELYVQGSAQAESTSDFRTDFSLASAGSVEFTGTIGVQEYLDYYAHDVPGYARVFVRIRNLDNNTNVVNKVVTMDGYIGNANGLIQVDIADELGSVSLPSGNYRLIFNATSNDQAINEQVGGAVAVAFFEVEGNIR